MSTVSESKPVSGMGPGLDGLLAPLPPQPLVSVVMTMFNSEATLEAGVRSLMGQTYRNIEIILSDDGSSDGTVALAEKLCAEDGRISLLQFGGNHGTYWAKNYGLRRSRGQVVTFADSDDTSDPRRIELQLEALRSPGVAVSTCAYSRVDETGAQLPVPGSRGFAFISQMIRRDVLELVGYFDSARTSADDEMLSRILISFGMGSHAIVSERLYTAVVREGSLSHNKDNPRYSPVTKGLSPPRRAYAEGFRAWHARVLESGAVPYIPFPVTNRPFPLDPKLEVRAGAYTRNFISVVAWGAGSSSQSRLEQLAVQCERDTACCRSWLDKSQLEGSLWKIHHAPTEEKARELVHSDQLPSGYVVFCDLDVQALREDFVQRVVMQVEQLRRPGIATVADQSGTTAQGDLHGRGAHTEGQGVGFEQVASGGQEAKTERGISGHASRGEVAFSESALQGQATRTHPVDSASEMPVNAGRVGRAVRDGTALFRQFLGLWSRSEQLIAGLLFVGAVVMVLGILTPWVKISILGMAGMLAGLGLAVLLNTRRTRLLADPALQLDSHQRLSSLVMAMGVFQQAHLGRGPKVLPNASPTTPASVATSQTLPGEPIAAVRSPVLHSAGDIASTIREIGDMPPAAGLARLSGIQTRYNVAPEVGHALAALRVILLAQAGRNELAQTELERMPTSKGAARDWAGRARALLDGKVPMEGAIEQVVREIVSGLEVKA